MFRLIKRSIPEWDAPIDLATLDEAVTELRRHICADCLAGSPGFLDDPVDVTFDGRVFECRDVGVLLGTPCGCEYHIEEIE
jgi:hypothetical protein